MAITPAGGAKTPAACDSTRLAGRLASRSPPARKRWLGACTPPYNHEHRTKKWQTTLISPATAQKSGWKPLAGSDTRRCPMSARVTPAASCSTTGAGSAMPTAATTGKRRARCARCPAARHGSPGAQNLRLAGLEPCKQPGAKASLCSTSRLQSRFDGWPESLHCSRTAGRPGLQAFRC